MNQFQAKQAFLSGYLSKYAGGGGESEEVAAARKRFLSSGVGNTAFNQRRGFAPDLDILNDAFKKREYRIQDQFRQLGAKYPAFAAYTPTWAYEPGVGYINPKSIALEERLIKDKGFHGVSEDMRTNAMRMQHQIEKLKGGDRIRQPKDYINFINGTEPTGMLQAQRAAKAARSAESVAQSLPTAASGMSRFLKPLIQMLSKGRVR